MFPGPSSQAIKLVCSKWLLDLNLDTNKGERVELRCFGLWQSESIFKEFCGNIPLGMDCV